MLWVVRGLGTAVLHGATTAVLAMIAKAMADRTPERAMLALLPGLGAAIVITRPTTVCWCRHSSRRRCC
jgi:hypothetical protein